MKRIAIDQDQVIADLLGEWLRRYNYDYNDNLAPEQVVEWNWHVLTHPECQEKVYSYLDDPDLFASLPVIKGSQQVIHELSKRYEIFFVTAPFNPNNVVPKENWFKMHFDFVPVDNYIYARNKSIVLADFLIDDKPKNLQTFRGAGKLLYDAPHNRNEKNYIRMNNWDHVRDYFNTYEQLEKYS